MYLNSTTSTTGMAGGVEGGVYVKVPLLLLLRSPYVGSLETMTGEAGGSGNFFGSISTGLFGSVNSTFFGSSTVGGVGSGVSSGVFGSVAVSLGVGVGVGVELRFGVEVGEGVGVGDETIPCGVGEGVGRGLREAVG